MYSIALFGYETKRLLLSGGICHILFYHNYSKDETRLGNSSRVSFLLVIASLWSQNFKACLINASWSCAVNCFCSALP